MKKFRAKNTSTSVIPTIAPRVLVRIPDFPSLIE